MKARSNSDRARRAKQRVSPLPRRACSPEHPRTRHWLCEPFLRTHRIGRKTMKRLAAVLLLVAAFTGTALAQRASEPDALGPATALSPSSQADRIEAPAVATPFGNDYPTAAAAHPNRGTA